MGFVDLQVNGYIGVDFSSPSLTAETCAKACKALLSHHTEAFLPTIITSSENIYERNFAIISEIITSPEFTGKVLGIHAEGPFISNKPGSIGAHDAEWVKKPDLELFDRMQKWACGTLKMLTIAAEVEGSEELAKHAVANGVTVSLGHQDADTDDLNRLTQAGAKLLTHLGNAMPNMAHRHNNPLLAGMGVDGLIAMIITDSHHLPPHVIKAIIKAKGTDKIIITSDASPLAGMPPGKYNVLGNQCVLEENGRLSNPEKQCLVGSSATMLECMTYLKSLNLLTDEEIELVSHTNPLNAIK